MNNPGSFLRVATRRVSIFVWMLTLSCGISWYCPSAHGQEPKPAPKPDPAKEAAGEAVVEDSSSRGSIIGRVVSEDGPMPFVQVSVTPVGGAGRGRGINSFRTTTTDEQGNFKVDGLGAMAWTIFAFAPGYVVEPTGDDGNRSFYRIGETATIRLQKGGVITGRVMNSGGEPVIAVPVSAQMVRDSQGNAASLGGAGSGFQTDDRGVYRIYGLQPGNYVVSAGRTGGQGPGGPRFNPYDGEVPTYFPSATRDTAIEVTVSQGAETSGIDVQYRGGKGHAISGKITGAPASGGGNRAGFGGPGGISVQLNSATTGTPVNRTFVTPREGVNSYLVYGVPDGEYEVIAERNTPGENDAMSVPRKVQVLGRDVTGIDLVLVPTASVDGSLQKAVETKEIKCALPHKPSFTEQIFELIYENPNETGSQNNRLMNGNRRQAAEKNGALSFQSLPPGRYRLGTRMLDESWYLKTITLPGAVVKTSARVPARPTLLDAGRNGITVKAGDRLKGLAITVAEGAAALKGKVVPAEGTGLAPSLRVLLVPAEKERQDDVLRFGIAGAAADGTFHFANLAPGKYWLVPSHDGDETRKKFLIPAERAKFQRDGEAAAIGIDLQPCQRIPDFQLKLKK